MNTNDPYIVAALPHWTGDPSPLDIDWRAQDMREADRERAAEARHGGRQITEYLVSFVGDAWRGRASAEQIAKAEAFDEATWSYQLAPSGEGNSADRLASLARRYAAQGSNESFPKSRLLTLDQAEAMLSWPIYRAGYTQSTEDCQSTGHIEYTYGPPEITESELRALDGDR